jgi:inorganic pyrophosphatase
MAKSSARYGVPDCDCFELATALPEGMAFPFDFGFIPSTLGDDGEPVDVLVLMDSPVMALDDIKAFFVDYNKLRDKQFEIRAEHGPNRAAKLVKKGVAAYKKNAT